MRVKNTLVIDLARLIVKVNLRMRYQEKKYRVDSFIKIQKILGGVGAKKGKEVVATHYYTQQENNDVIKLVKYSDRNEIHMLEESKGKFSLKENSPVENTEVGLQWLKDKGYKTVNLVKMAQVDYEYKNGIVGLYFIDDFLYSVILDFPQQQHESIEKEFELDNAGVISIAFNKYLKQIGQLRSMKLS